MCPSAQAGSVGDRFDTLVEGLPLLRALGRAADDERAVAASGEQVRTATLATLRIALLAGLVLELLAAVGAALVAVRLGLRLDAGQRILPQALAVLILVPEVFLPLRRLTADFHAGTTGVPPTAGRVHLEGPLPAPGWVPHHRHARPVGRRSRPADDRTASRPRQRPRSGPAPPRIVVGVPDGRPVTGSPRSATGSPRLGLDRRDQRRVLVAAGVGLAGELAALGLLTTGAWLLLSASLRPPILLLSIAIGAVQLFSFLRGTARYAERLASHSLGLSLQADLRAWLYRRLAQLVPCGLPGGDRGDLLTRLIRDTEEAQDLVVRAAVPVLAAAAAWAAAVVTAVVLLPPVGWAILAAGILAAAGIAVAVILADRTAAELPAARGAVASWALGTLTAWEELAALGAGEWALDQTRRARAGPQRPHQSRRRRAGPRRVRARWGSRAGRGGLDRRGGAASRADRPRRTRRPGLPGPRRRRPVPWPARRRRPPARQPGLPDPLASLGSLPRPGPGCPRTIPPPSPVQRPEHVGPPPSPCAGRQQPTRTVRAPCSAT